MLATFVAAAAMQLVTIATPSANVDVRTAVVNEPRTQQLMANVLLPAGYDGRRRFPVLVLLHGVGDRYDTWARPDRGDIQRTAAGLGAIVVMPEGGRGFYTNWFRGGRRGARAGSASTSTS